MENQHFQHDCAASTNEHLEWRKSWNCTMNKSLMEIEKTQKCMEKRTKNMQRSEVKLVKWFKYSSITDKAMGEIGEIRGYNEGKCCQFHRKLEYWWKIWKITHETRKNERKPLLKRKNCWYDGGKGEISVCEMHREWQTMKWKADKNKGRFLLRSTHTITFALMKT